MKDKRLKLKEIQVKSFLTGPDRILGGVGLIGFSEGKYCTNGGQCTGGDACTQNC